MENLKNSTFGERKVAETKLKTDFFEMQLSNDKMNSDPQI